MKTMGDEKAKILDLFKGLKKNRVLKIPLVLLKFLNNKSFIQFLGMSFEVLLDESINENEYKFKAFKVHLFFRNLIYKNTQISLLDTMKYMHLIIIEKDLFTLNKKLVELDLFADTCIDFSKKYYISLVNFILDFNLLNFNEKYQLICYNIMTGKIEYFDFPVNNVFSVVSKKVIRGLPIVYTLTSKEVLSLNLDSAKKWDFIRNLNVNGKRENIFLGYKKGIGLKRQYESICFKTINLDL